MMPDMRRNHEQRNTWKNKNNINEIYFELKSNLAPHKPRIHLWNAGPGTGKTCINNVTFHYAKMHGIVVVSAASTGIAEHEPTAKFVLH